jgi:hypothetical protein
VSEVIAIFFPVTVIVLIIDTVTISFPNSLCLNSN